MDLSEYGAITSVVVSRGGEIVVEKYIEGNAATLRNTRQVHQDGRRNADGHGDPAGSRGRSRCVDRRAARRGGRRSAQARHHRPRRSHDELLSGLQRLGRQLARERGVHVSAGGLGRLRTRPPRARRDGIQLLHGRRRPPWRRARARTRRAAPGFARREFSSRSGSSGRSGRRRRSGRSRPRAVSCSRPGPCARARRALSPGRWRPRAGRVGGGVRARMRRSTRRRSTDTSGGSGASAARNAST